MITTCYKCHQEYDDTYYSTQCPHKYFEMHCAVTVNGQSGCAHTVEELDRAANENILPNPECEYQGMLENLRDEVTMGIIVDRAVAKTNAEILPNGGRLPDEVYGTESES